MEKGTEVNITWGKTAYKTSDMEGGREQDHTREIGRGSNRLVGKKGEGGCSTKLSHGKPEP